MKKLIFIYTTFLSLLALPLVAQVSQDSIKALNERDKALDVSKSINDKKLKLADKQKELVEKTAELEKKNEEARNSVEANRQAASALTGNPQDKKLAKNANNAAKDAQRDARNARKVTEDVDKLNEDIADLQKEIREEEEKLATITNTTVPASNPTQVVTPQTAGNASYGSTNTNAPAYSTAPAQANASQAPTIIQRNISADSLGGGNPAEMAQRVVESTYRSYPQQQGQPSIIINNIIVPSDYHRQQQGSAAPVASGESYEDYQAWLRYRRQEQGRRSFSREQPAYSDMREDEAMQERDRLTFRERFGEKPARNSGLWVIPMVGIHASNFNANLKDGKYDGRTGWNAGIDFRARMKKFFIQPGIHYFSSSMEVSSEDSLAEAPLLTGPRIHSLKAPLMVGVYLTKAKGGFFRFNVKGGIVGNYILAVDKSNLETFDRDNIEDFSYGLNAGFGLEFGFITLDFSHEWGMSPLFKDTNQKNNILRGTIGFKL